MLLNLFLFSSHDCSTLKNNNNNKKEKNIKTYPVESTCSSHSLRFRSFEINLHCCWFFFKWIHPAECTATNLQAYMKIHTLTHTYTQTGQKAKYSTIERMYMPVKIYRMQIYFSYEIAVDLYDRAKFKVVKKIVFSSSFPWKKKTEEGI